MILFCYGNRNMNYKKNIQNQIIIPNCFIYHTFVITDRNKYTSENYLERLLKVISIENFYEVLWE